MADSNRLEAMRQRRIKRKMGACKYFCWPCGRAEYDKMFPRANVVVVDPAVEEEERLRKVFFIMTPGYMRMPGQLVQTHTTTGVQSCGSKTHVFV